MKLFPEKGERKGLIKLLKGMVGATILAASFHTGFHLSKDYEPQPKEDFSYAPFVLENTSGEKSPGNLALIVKGGLHWYDFFDNQPINNGFVDVYNSLIQRGYTPDRICVLSGFDRKRESERLNLPVDGSASNDSVRKYFEHLKQQGLDEQDSLFVYFTGHGNKNLPGENWEGELVKERFSDYSLYGRDVSAPELRSLFQRLGRGVKIEFVNDVCYGKGLADVCGSLPNVNVSSADTKSDSLLLRECKEFITSI
jgi:hypothetical protein